ncbi:MAG TPA: hypothetical protein VGN17_16945 [Bryobacteraceae bacterium]
MRTRLPEQAAASPTIQVDLEIEFAGQTARFAKVPVQLAMHGQDIKISGTIPSTLSDFKIDPPKLLTVPVKNEMPVKVDMTFGRP